MKPNLKGINKRPDKVGSFRRILPQFLASTAKNLLILDVGLTIAIPAVVIPALTGRNNENNPNEFLHMTPVQASWLASISFVGQPLGSAFSGFFTETLGRKWAMILVNIPHIAAWLMLYYAQSLEMIFTAFAFLGLGVGLMEAPIYTYLGEICEPSIRGVLVACAGIACTFGIFMVFLLGTITTWRITSLICAGIPTVTIIAIYFVPETPIWLISRGRFEEAMKSLQWLRGWVSPVPVTDEFNDLKRYNQTSNSCTSCEKLAVKCPHPAPTLWEKIKDLSRKRTLKPFILLIFQFFVMQFCGIFAMRPYIVQILEAHGIPWNANKTTVVLGVLGIIANAFLLIMIKMWGKRNIYLWSMVFTFLSCFGLSSYGYKYFPVGWSSFEKHNITLADGEVSTSISSVVGNASYFALFMFLLMQFATSIGVSAIPNMIMSELLPFKSRAFTTGLVAAINYILAFVATKTYYDLEIILSIPGVIGCYGIVGVIGFIVMYLTLPETEMRTLEDIELHFADNSKSITDINIRINSAAELTEIDVKKSASEQTDRF